MAQDIIIAGAQYPEVPAINIPKTAGGTALFVDTSEDTITAEKLLNGTTAHDKNGEKVTGTLPEVVQATPIIDVDVMGKVTAHASQKAGVVAAGTKSATMQLPTQDPGVIIPSSSMQIAVEKGVFTTGFIRVAAVFAVIGVTYPAGSTCTCTNGKTTLTAEDTSGRAMFIIPETGTWTVTAVDGDKTASKAAEITAGGQVEAIELTYALYLYNQSDITSITGGWQGIGHSFGNSDNNLVLDVYKDQIKCIHLYGYHGSVYKRWTACTKNAIDVTKFSTMKAKILSSGIRTGVAIWQSTGDIAYGDPIAIQTCGDSRITTPTTISLDISNLTGALYPSLTIRNAVSGNVYASEIWLE